MKLSKFSPVARAIGVIGGTAALVTGVTFANLTSNSVALSPNDIAVATASLVIDNNSNCADNSPTSVTGFQITNLAPGVPVSKNFCLRNTGEVSLLISGSVSGSGLDASAAAQATTLEITCGTDAGISGTLATNWSTTFPTALGVSTSEDCTAKVTLSQSYGGAGGDVIPTFSINFVGTQPTPVVES